MKKCPICGRKVTSKRRDAIYCRNPRCRKEAFLARKEQAATAPLPIGKNKASVVVSFPDGSRWLMEPDATTADCADAVAEADAG